MHIPVLGIVENYSFMECPDCGRKIKLFGESGIDQTAAELGVPVLGKLPLNPEFAKAVDEGRFFELENPYLAEAVKRLEEM